MNETHSLEFLCVYFWFYQNHFIKQLSKATLLQYENDVPSFTYLLVHYTPKPASCKNKRR